MLFFKKKKKTEEQIAAEGLPLTKKVMFTPEDIKELTEALEQDKNALLKLSPVNYYASKYEYLQCTFFYNEDYSSVYFLVEYYDCEKVTGSTPYIKGDYELMKKTVIKFGQRI